MDKKEYKHNWYLKNKEKLKQQRKKYYENNKEYNKNYYQKNKENEKQRAKQYYFKNKEKQKKCNKKSKYDNGFTNCICDDKDENENTEDQNLMQVISEKSNLTLFNTALNIFPLHIQAFICICSNGDISSGSSNPTSSAK